MINIYHNYRQSKLPLATYLSLILLLDGCATTHKTPNIVSPDWTLNAKVLVKDINGKKDSAIIQWEKDADTFKINAFNSFSQPLFTLYSSPKFARFDAANGKHAEAKSVDNLLQQNLGWSIPMNAVEAWLQGRLIGSESNVKRNAEGQLESLTYQQFSVTLKKYRTFGHHIRPSDIALKSQPFSLRLVIKSYEQHS